MLQNLGYRVVQALNGHEALAALAQAPVDLVVTDLAMPEMDGIALVRALRADARYRHLPVIMLTSSGLEADVQPAEIEGVDRFLTKPVSSHELREMVTGLLAEHAVEGGTAVPAE
jgi:two-component system chemotaxis response regulator CheY